MVPAITLNSNNNVSNEGTVSISGVNNSTSIQGLGGFTGTISNTGSISNSESFTPNVNGDGLNDAPLASVGSTGRYGIRIGPGSSPLVGDIVNTGTISVQGDKLLRHLHRSAPAGRHDRDQRCDRRISQRRDDLLRRRQWCGDPLHPWRDHRRSGADHRER